MNCSKKPFLIVLSKESESSSHLAFISIVRQVLIRVEKPCDKRYRALHLEVPKFLLLLPSQLASLLRIKNYTLTIASFKGSGNVRSTLRR